MDLFALIKSLKPTEKRYFTLSAGLMTPAKKNNYLRLFEVLDAMDSYDESLLKTKYRKEAFAKNLAVYKSQLFDSILASLRNYNEENIEEWDIRKDLYKIQLLAQKGLDKDCEAAIHKTKQKAWQYELYHILLEILDIQLYLFGNCRIGHFDPEYRKQIQSEKDRVLHFVKMFDLALDGWHRINLYFQLPAENHTYAASQEIDQLIQTLEELQPNIPGDAYLLINRYLACFELYYNGIGNAERCYYFNSLLVENRQKLDEKMPNLSTDAMAVYFNFMVACFKFQKWNEMETYLEKTLHYPIQSLQQEIRRAHNYCYCGILLYLSTGALDKAAEVVSNFELARKKYAGKYRLDFLLFTLCQCGWYYFLKKDYDSARQIWREITQGPRYSVETRAQAMTRFYQLILFYTLEETDLFASELVNTRRYLQNHHLLGENEMTFLNSFKKLNHSPSDKHVLNVMVTTLKSSSQVMTERSVLNAFMVGYFNNQISKIGPGLV
ncbi:MAG: hypothetical protein IPK46_01630 [Saprospiraceae bacterium]|nr:hypothetical protein [Saprospiraceae bacterium]